MRSLISSGLALLLLVVAACGGGPTSARQTPTPALSIISGDAQADTVTQELPDALVVAATDPSGAPLPNFTVSWVVADDGCGTPFAYTSQTDVQGKASNRWTLGDSAFTTLGHDCRLIARAMVDQQPVTFDTLTAHAVPAPVWNVSPGERIGNAATSLLLPGRYVTDRYRNPAMIRVEIPSSGPLAAGDSVFLPAGDVYGSEAARTVTYQGSYGYGIGCIFDERRQLNTAVIVTASQNGQDGTLMTATTGSWRGDTLIVLYANAYRDSIAPADCGASQVFHPYNGVTQ